MTNLLKKPHLTKTILVIMTISIFTTNILLVRADPGGIGKFLDITVNESQTGEVTLTKLSSGEQWIINDYELIKMAAGDVNFYAEPYNGYAFDYWLIDGQRIEEPEYNFKTSQGTTEIEAYFIKTYKITATAIGPGTINGTTFLEVDVEDGANSPLFTFASDSEEDHISSIQIDTGYIGYAESFAFDNPITSDHDIVVYFDEEGVARVPDAQNVPVFLNSILNLFFDNTGGGVAEGNELYVPEGSSIMFWNITTNAVDSDINITIAFKFDPSLAIPVVVYRAESADALYSDANLDGVVDGSDVSYVAQAIKTTVSSGAEYDPLLDIDRDGDLDEDDVHTVNDNKGTELSSLAFSIEGNIIYIETDHFSVFRCR